MDIIALVTSNFMYNCIGAKKTYVYGNLLVAIVLLVMAIGLQYELSYISFPCVFIYMLVFQATLGPVTWIVLLQIVSSELMNIPVATHWILN